MLLLFFVCISRFSPVLLTCFMFATLGRHLLLITSARVSYRIAGLMIVTAMMMMLMVIRMRMMMMMMLMVIRMMDDDDDDDDGDGDEDEDVGIKVK